VTRVHPVVVLVVGALLLALVPALRLPAFYESFLYLVFFWISLATSWNILSGYAGYFSFGHAAFFGAGVYTTATLATALDVPFLSTFAALAIYRSRWGMGLFAIRDDEDVAEVLGVPTYRYKLTAFALSCFIAGLIGGIHAMFVTYVTVAETFAVGLAVDAIMMAPWAAPGSGTARRSAPSSSPRSPSRSPAGRARS